MNASFAEQLSQAIKPRAGRQTRPSGGKYFVMLGSIAFCALLLSGTGCRMMVPAEGIEGPTKVGSDVKVNAVQMRLRMRALVDPLSSSLVKAADGISAGSTDRAIRREALLWKLEGVPALREALFRPDPVTALLDAWALAWQMVDYFESGPGAEALGSSGPVAAGACRYLEGQIETVSASMTHSRDVADVRRQVREWATENPIRDSIAGRESILSQVTEVQIPQSFQMTQMVGNLAVTLDDLSRRIDVHTDQLLDQARWQAELLMMDWGIDYRLDKAIPLAQEAAQSIRRIEVSFEELVPEVEAALKVAESAPQLVSKERAAALAAAHEEVSRTIQFVHEERVESLQDLKRELDQELEELKGTLHQERLTLASDIERISRAAVEHATWRAAQLSGAILIAVFIAVVVLLHLARRIFMPHAETSKG